MKWRWQTLIVIASPALAACGPHLPGTPDQPAPLFEHQPSVAEADPATGAIRPRVEQVRVRFSKPVDALSVHAGSVAVLRDVPSGTPSSEVLTGWESATYPALAGTPQLSADGMEAKIVPAAPIDQPGEYATVVTTAVRSPSGVPFSQRPGGIPLPFIGFFSVGSNGNAPTAEGALQPSSGGGEVAAQGGEGGGVLPPLALRIEEVLYDSVGTDANGETFIELSGTAGAVLEGYRLQLVNGETGGVLTTLTIPKGMRMPEDEYFVIADALTGNAAASAVESADWIVNMDPQNGPDTIRLLDPQGTPVDIVGYGADLPAEGADGLPLSEGAPAQDVGEGMSLSRLPGSADTDRNSDDFVANAAPSPGRAEVTPPK